MRIDAAGSDRRRRNQRAASLAALLPLLLAAAAGCGGKDSPKPTKPEAALDAAPDFHLVDVNPASARHDEKVSPRDYLDRVSAWYFGHAT